MNPQEYRNKHHRCKGCKYSKLIIPPHCIAPDYYTCLVKDKIISDLFGNGRGCFCNVYRPKELDFEI